MENIFSGIIDGYVRLSRDDNKRNYSSIENQKLIIREYAEKHNMTVRHIYEDDNISGYSFDRPAFQEMMSNLPSISTIIAKDLSRIGRHNARVLLFLEEMEELGKRVILIDDDYDSLHSDNDIIGIKTWDNERHVKSTSRKVRRIKRMAQENGTLLSRPPFGYIRHPLNRQTILIDEEAASILHLEKELYLSGNGIRKTAELLSEQGVPTPSMLEKERFESMGLPYHRQAASRWSYGMVKDTLFNDYHNGILRTHKRERTAINGKDRRLPPEEHFVFPGHHPKIFDDDTARLLLETRDSRHHSCYRGQRTHINLFSGCLYCKDCGRKLTAINRPGKPKYYVCGTYNKKGKQFCCCSHRIMESTLIDALTGYLSFCRSRLADSVRCFDLSALKTDTYTQDDRRNRLERELKTAQEDLKLLLCRSLPDTQNHSCTYEIIKTTYESLLLEKAEQIAGLEKNLADLGSAGPDRSQSGSHTFSSALDILDLILEQKNLTRADIEIMVQKIIVDRDGNPDIYLRHFLSS